MTSIIAIFAFVLLIIDPHPYKIEHKPCPIFSRMESCRKAINYFVVLFTFPDNFSIIQKCQRYLFQENTKDDMCTCTLPSYIYNFTILAEFS